jgi:predicted amidophosphoribosyltransferase
MDHFEKSKARIIPVPSSIAHDSPNFKTTPRQKGEKRNRDDRNLAFCNLLATHDTRIEVRNFLFRTTSKTEKETWTADQHAASLVFASDITPKRDFKGLMILIDDVITDGGTMEGAKIILAEQYPEAVIIKLAIGFSRSPHDFTPL